MDNKNNFFYVCVKKGVRYISTDANKIRAIKPYIYDVNVIVPINTRRFGMAPSEKYHYKNNDPGNEETLLKYVRLVGKDSVIVL